MIFVLIFFNFFFECNQVCPPFAGHDVWICHWMGDRYISAHEVDVDLFLDQINAFYDFKLRFICHSQFHVHANGFQ